MTDDVEALVEKARLWKFDEVAFDPGAAANLIVKLADALEAATVAPAVDREALARAIAGGDAIFYAPQRALAFMKADEIFASGLLRDVRDVQAEALEEAANDIEPLGYGGTVTNILRARAQAIREARSER